MTVAEKFIEKAIQAKGQRVKIFFINGYQMKGFIVEGDMSGILFDSDEYKQAIFIHMSAISTIVPI